MYTPLESNTLDSDWSELSDEIEMDPDVNPTTSPRHVCPSVVHSENSFPSDKALFTSNYEQNLQLLVQEGSCQPEEKDMPGNHFPYTKGKGSFKSSHYYVINSLGESVRRHWLAYSYKSDYCYCHTCWLFGDSEAKKSVWVNGVTDWYNIKKTIIAHAKSAAHHRSVVSYSAFAISSKQCIDSAFQKQIEAEVSKWKVVLTHQFSLIRVLTSLGLPLRGHREGIDDDNPGVYLSILKHIGRIDPILGEHINSQQKIKYLSKTITDEQVEILAANVRAKIISMCRESKFFTVIVDSTTDISHKDQMAMLLRFVYIERESKTFKIDEHFIGFYHVINATAQGICDLVYKVLFEDLALEHKHLKGQAYDGASVMSGRDGGVQALVKKVMLTKGNDFVPYVHCPPHQLNLVLKHAAESGTPPPPVEVVNFFDLVQTIYNFFNRSNRRWQLLLDTAEGNAKLSLEAAAELLATCSSEDEDDEHDQDRTIRLKSLSKTRWAAHKNAVYALLHNFGNVIDSLAKLIDEHHDSAEVKEAIDLQKKMDWEFLFTLLWWDDVLSIVNVASRILQAKSNDLFIVVDCFNQALLDLEALRSDKEFDNFIQRAKSIWLNYGFEEEEANFKIVRVRRVKRMDGETLRDQCPSDSTERYKISVYFHVLDTMTSEIRSRTKDMKDVCSLFGFLHPQHFSKISKADLEKQAYILLERFPEEFSFSLVSELHDFQTLYFCTGGINTTGGVVEYLSYLVNTELCDLYPQFEILIRLFITLPIGIASAERSFSTLRRIKNYLRSTMGQKRLSNLALLAIEHKIAENLNLDTVISEFSMKKARRGLRL